MLHAHFPVSLVVTPVLPKHFAIAMSLIHIVTSYVVVSRLPVELALSMLLVVVILACVLITIWVLLILLPFAFSVLHSLPELSDVESSRLPLVLTVAVRSTVFVHASVHIEVGEIVCALPVFQAAGPLAFILVAIRPLVNTEAPDLVVSPLSHVCVILESSPDAEAIFARLQKLTVIRLT